MKHTLHRLRTLLVVLLVPTCLSTAYADVPGTLHHTRFALNFGLMIERDSLIPLLGDTTQKQNRSQPYIDTLTWFDVQSIVPGEGSCVYVQARARVERLILQGPDRFTWALKREYVQLYQTCDSGRTMVHLGTIFIPDGYTVRDLISDGDLNPVLGFEPREYTTWPRNGYYAITRRYNRFTQRWDSEYASNITAFRTDKALQQLWWRSRDTGLVSTSIGTVDGGRTMKPDAWGGIGLIAKPSDSIQVSHHSVLFRGASGEWDWENGLGADWGYPLPSVPVYAWFYNEKLLIGPGRVVDGDWAVRRAERINESIGRFDEWVGTTTDGVLMFLHYRWSADEDSVHVIASTDFGITLDTIATTPTRSTINGKRILTYAPTYERGPARCYFSERIRHHKYNGFNRWRWSPDTISVWHYEPSAYPSADMRWPPDSASGFDTPIRFICPATLNDDVEVTINDGIADTVVRWTGPTSLVRLTKRFHTYSWRYRIRRNDTWTAWSAPWTLSTHALLHWTPLQAISGAVTELDNGHLVGIGFRRDSVHNDVLGLWVSTNKGARWEPIEINGYRVAADTLLRVGSAGVFVYARPPGHAEGDPAVCLYVPMDGGPLEQVPRFPLERSIASSNGVVYTSYEFGIRRSRDRGITWDSLAMPGIDPRARISAFLPSGQLFASVKNEFEQSPGRTIDTVGVVIDTATFSIQRLMTTPTNGGHRYMIDPVFLSDTVWMCLMERYPAYYSIRRTTDAGATWKGSVLPMPAPPGGPAHVRDVPPVGLAFVKDSLILCRTSSFIRGSYDGITWFPLESGTKQNRLLIDTRPRGDAYVQGGPLLTLVDITKGEGSPYVNAVSREGINGDQDARGIRDVSSESANHQRPWDGVADRKMFAANAPIEIPAEMQDIPIQVVVSDALGRLLEQRTYPAGTRYVVVPDAPEAGGLRWLHIVDPQGQQATRTIGVIQ